jgi:hypothetical protein
MLYELEATCTETGEVRYRTYTRSKKLADLFAKIPKLQYSDSGHGVVFSSVEVRRRRKPDLVYLTDHVRRALCVHTWKPVTFDEETGKGTWRCKKCGAERERTAAILCKEPISE